jgi:hypothetical protein
MTKSRKSSTIMKPVIDEDTALRFAAAGSQQASGAKTDSLPKSALKKPPAVKTGSHENIGKGMQQISFTISKALYNIIAKDAARKDRTVEEHLKRHLIKIYEK